MCKKCIFRILLVFCFFFSAIGSADPGQGQGPARIPLNHAIDVKRDQTANKPDNKGLQKALDRVEQNRQRFIDKHINDSGRSSASDAIGSAEPRQGQGQGQGPARVPLNRAIDIKRDQTADKPDNKGLQNALDRVEQNRQRFIDKHINGSTRSGVSGEAEGSKGDNSDSPGRSAAGSQTEIIERSPAIERVESTGSRPERVERAERPNRPERVERVERVERPNRPERVARPNRPERVQRVDRIDRPGRGLGR